LCAEDRLPSVIKLYAVSAFLFSEPGKELVVIDGQIGVDYFEGNRRAKGWTLDPVVFNEQEVVAELLTMQAVAKMTVVVDGDTHSPVSRVDHIRTPDDYILGWHAPREQRLVAVFKRVHS
jgi:hypothetical protein